MSSKQDMDLVQHLGELRKRIIWVVIVLVICMVAGFVIAKPIIKYLMEAAPDISLHALSPWDSVRLYVNVAFIFALVISLPFTLFQVWAFVKPGLKPKEQKASLAYVPFAFLMVLVGLSFGYFVVFPLAFLFTSTITESLGLTETYGIAQYFSFMFNILIPLAVIFQLPVVVMFLTKLKILNPNLLKKVRKFAYFTLVVLGTLVTPPDAITALIVAVPMILLYEFSVLLSKRVFKKQLEMERAWEEEYGEK
ncbi:twin-arginine translocase subunit TatC [Chengkuizengella axinellae]|uniref:Sec-independent protein translocase protein TatC n=1 Tax=Chengkuizengella axinellae TaxID=3064388 RepID=A0ABT9J4W9_9BACL|nr:twin-arginine translocase subunit TatC [Chengkuizengella sp. 2205SS18-9]MDP5276639.1 twin-arginine translocase subunit TatC [Chengkuizengella sp. 2205SS18-9]